MQQVGVVDLPVPATSPTARLMFCPLSRTGLYEGSRLHSTPAATLRALAVATQTPQR